MIKINVLGSCVSRVSLLDGVQSAHGVLDDRLDLGYFLDKQNIVCAMLPAPFSREEVDTITVDELDDKSRLHSLKQCLNKSTVSMRLNLTQNILLWIFMIWALISVHMRIPCLPHRQMSSARQHYTENMQTRLVLVICTT